MPVIYQYFNLSDFLRDDFAERKAKTPFFSIRGMSAKLGLDASTLTHIINGKRNIGKTIFPRFVQFLGLRGKEADYFRHLTIFCQAKRQLDRFGSYRELIALRNGGIGRIDEGAFAYFEQWYFCAVREFLRVYPFRGDFAALGRSLNPAISARKARQAVKLLERIGFVKKTGDVYFVENNDISTGERWSGTAIHRFQQEMAVKSLEALDRFPKSERDFSTMTMCYSPDGFKKVRELIKDTRDELRRIEESDGTRDRVYQINMQVFPLSKPVTGD